MSAYIELLHKDKVITSLAAGGTYNIAVHRKETVPAHFLFMGADKSYTYEQYCDVLKKLWEDYITAGKKPKLLRLTLSDDGLVTETLHCIAPGAWTASGAPPLAQYRETFAYWLKSNISKIRSKIGQEQFASLNKSLEWILQTHIARKNAV